MGRSAHILEGYPRNRRGLSGRWGGRLRGVKVVTAIPRDYLIGLLQKKSP